MKPVVIIAASSVLCLIALPQVQAAPITITRSKDHLSKAVLSTRTSPVELAKDLLSTPVSAANSVGSIASDTSTVLPSQPNQIQSAASTVLARPSSIVGEESASFYPHLSLDQLRGWTRRKPRSALAPRLARLDQLKGWAQRKPRSAVASRPAKPSSWQSTITFSRDQSALRSPAEPSSRHFDSYTPDPGRKRPTKQSAMPAKTKKKSEKDLRVAKRPYTRRLFIPEGATDEEKELAKKKATRENMYFAKLRFRAKLTPEQKKAIRTRDAERKRIRYAQGKAGSLAKVSSVKATSPDESNVLPQASADVGVSAHTPASPASVPQFETSDWARQHELHTATTSSASGPQEAESSDSDEDWRSFLAPDLFQ